MWFAINVIVLLHWLLLFNETENYTNFSCCYTTVFFKNGTRVSLWKNKN